MDCHYSLASIFMSSMRVNMRVITTTVAIASVASLAIGTATADGVRHRIASRHLLDLSDSLTKPSSPLYSYPTDLTREVVPKAIHSHNDYWRALPFYTALSYGCISVEADVWLYNGTLYVGHEPSALTSARTFEALYIRPILSTLSHENPSSAFVKTATKNGVFDGYSSQTIYLFVDVKTDGIETWPYVLQALEPLRSAGYLSRIENASSTSITYAPITVIGTGNTPLSKVQPVASRDYFWDGPIPTLDSTFANITSLVSPIASTNFAVQFGTVQGTTGIFNASQLARLRSQVAVAHTKGIMLRYWNQPAWPISLRNGIWKQLWDEGVDLINADDVAAAAEAVWEA